jgi:hypothetical protein
MGAGVPADGVFHARVGPARRFRRQRIDDRDDARLAYFLDLLPGWIRTAVEFRHASWHDDELA